MKISQTTIDDLMPELNHIIMMHNTGNPLFPLKQLPNQKGSIPLRDKNELETQFGITFDNITAFYEHDTEGIYIVKENLEEEISGLKEATIGKIGPQKEIEKVFLLNLLLHENGHRSCKRVTQQDYVRDTYMDAALQFFEDTPCYQEIYEANEFNGSMWAKGLAIEFEHPKGLWNISSNRLDEFVNTWMTSSILSYYLPSKGYFQGRAHSMGYSLWIKFPDDQDDTFFSAMNAILDSPQQDSFLHDYIHANIPQKIIDHGQKVGMLDGAPLNALAGQLYGGLDSLPDLMQGIYSTPSDE